MSFEIDRLVEIDGPERQLAELGGMVMMLYGLPRPIDAVDAIVVLPGLGEDWRVQQAVRTWEASETARHLLVTGTYPEERTQIPPSLENLIEDPFNLQRTDGVQCQVAARNTLEQAQWLAQQVDELGIASIGLHVSPYHLLRGYCTVLKALDKSGQRIPIIPEPVAVSAEQAIPETGGNGWTSVPGELVRMTTYQEKGDVATAAELREYLAWMWTQPLLAETA